MAECGYKPNSRRVKTGRSLGPVLVVSQLSLFDEIQANYRLSHKIRWITPEEYPALTSWVLSGLASTSTHMNL